jgi:hypothetical protein
VDHPSEGPVGSRFDLFDLNHYKQRRKGVAGLGGKLGIRMR